MEVNFKMNQYSLKIKIIILTFLISTNSYGLSSSAYLIVQSAIFSNDYHTASKYYLEIEDSNLNLKNLEQKMISFINSNNFKDALVIAKKINQVDINNEKAWIIILLASFSNVKEKNNQFKKIERLKLIKNFNILKYIFYNNENVKEGIDKISNSLLDIAKMATNEKIESLDNYKNLLFYINLSVYANPTSNEGLFFSAFIYQELDNFIMAEKIYNKIDKNSFLYLEGQMNIVSNKNTSGYIDEAEKLLKHHIKNDKKNISLVMMLADLYRSSSQFNKCILSYSKIIDIINIDQDLLSRAFFKRGICYEKQEKWKLAEKDFLISLEINYEDPQVLNYLAYAWIEKNVFIDKSIKMLLKASKRDPDNHYILDSLAWAYFKNNNLLQAAKIMEDVIVLAPEEAISLDHLGDIYFSLGRKREAYFMWKQARDLANIEDDILNKIDIKIQNYDG